MHFFILKKALSNVTATYFFSAYVLIPVFCILNVLFTEECSPFLECVVSFLPVVTSYVLFSL